MTARERNAQAKRDALADPIQIARELAVSDWLAARLELWPDPWADGAVIPPTVDGTDGARVHPAWIASGATTHLEQLRNELWRAKSDPKRARRQMARRAVEGLADLPEKPESESGLSLLAAWYDHRPAGAAHRHLVATREKHPPKDSDPLTMTRQPGLLSLMSHAPLEAVAVDGEAFATRTVGGVETKLRRYQLAESQGDLFPGPRKLAGQATAGAIFEAVAFMVLAGDERSPLRADLLRLANLAFALTGQVKLTEAEGALLVAGADTQPNRQRFNNALWALRGLGVQVRPGIWYRMAAADPDLGNVIGPATWWKKAMTGGLEDAPTAWRFTGCLFVPASKWGAVERTISGLESALLWGSSPGAGKRGRLPDNVQPVRRGGPGPEVFVPWWQVLRLSGENVGPDTDPRGAEGRRYRRRCEDLKGAGYLTARTGTAPAGGTVEVVEQRRGSRARPAGLIVRASARFCAAYGNNERVNLPASRLLTARS